MRKEVSKMRDKCIICNMKKKGSKEHIIPEAMGNSKLITYDVCEECNNKLGSKVDSYLTNYIVIKMIRKDMGLLGKSEKEIKVFPNILTTVDGEQYIMEGDTPKRKAKVDIENGMLHIEASCLQEGISIAKKRLERMGKSKEEINEILNTCQIGEKQSTQPTFVIPADIDIGRYLLSGIKIAYEYTCKVMGEIYFQDEVAAILREILYKASVSDIKEEAVDYEQVSQYAAFAYEQSVNLKNVIKPALDLFATKPRHIIILHDSADHQMICEVYLGFIDIMSFAICVSKDATKYLKNSGVRICILFENGDLIEM